MESQPPDRQESPNYWLIIKDIWASQVALVVKNAPYNVGDTRDTGLIHNSGRSPGAGNVNPLQYSCLENSTDRRAQWVTARGAAKNRTRLSMHSTHKGYYKGHKCPTLQAHENIPKHKQSQPFHLGFSWRFPYKSMTESPIQVITSISNSTPRGQGWG